MQRAAGAGRWCPYPPSAIATLSTKAGTLTTAQISTRRTETPTITRLAHILTRRIDGQTKTRPAHISKRRTDTRMTTQRAHISKRKIETRTTTLLARTYPRLHWSHEAAALPYGLLPQVAGRRPSMISHARDTLPRRRYHLLIPIIKPTTSHTHCPWSPPPHHCRTCTPCPPPGPIYRIHSITLRTASLHSTCILRTLLRPHSIVFRIIYLRLAFHSHWLLASLSTPCISIGFLCIVPTGIHIHHRLIYE